MKKLTQIIVPLLLGALVACTGGGTTTPTVPGSGPVTVAPKSVTLKAGDKTTFSATVEDTTEPKVLWSVEGGDTHGTITSTGVYTAPTEAGTYTVVATNAVDSTKTDAATVTVTPAVVVSISPGSAAVNTGASATFTATVTGASDTSVTWSVQEGTAGGSITAAGVYTAPTAAGSYTVVATSVADPTRKATASVTVTAPVVAVVAVAVSPDAVTLDQGASQTFTATVTGSSNTAVTWRVDGTGSGTITADGVYTAPTKEGSFKVIATSVADTTKTATATVSVHAVSVALSPTSASVATQGSVAFYATVSGTSGSKLVTWSVEGGAANGSITAAGVYTAPATAGTYTVTATSVADTTKKASATVTVAAVAVAVSPATATVDQGGTATFTASVTGSSNTAVTWRVDGTGNGTITSDGIYTAPTKAGTFTVIATSVADTTKSGSATVTVGAISVAVSPTTQTLDQGASAPFTAIVTGTSNTAVTWSVDGTGSGTITSDGVYTAPTKAGTFKVTATSVANTAQKASATVTVNAVSITLSPATASAQQGTTATFTATVTGTLNTAVTWRVEGTGNGTIDSDGVYTAPTRSGTFTVIATSVADSTKKATATVTVAAITVAVSPTTQTLDQGGTVTFSASVTGASDTSVTWSVGGTGSGTITSDGVYTAPNKAGTYTVTATSVANTAQKASATVTVNAVSVTVTPATSSTQQGASTTFKATVTGTPNTAVTWRVDATGSGTITSDGVYTAPNKTGTFKVIATSVGDPTAFGSATITVAAAAGSNYQDPSSTGWRLVKNTTASSGNKLVLDLVGPAGQSGRGVDLTLAVNPDQAHWIKVVSSDTEYVSNQKFTLGAAPQLLKGLVQTGTLKVGVYQKGTTTPAVAYSGALVSVALELNLSSSTPAGTVIPLTVVKAHALPDSGALAPITVAVGTITAQ